MCVHQAVPTTQAGTTDRWREAVRERWRITLLSAWERDRVAVDGAVTACSRKVAFLRQKVRLTRANAGCK